MIHQTVKLYSSLQEVWDLEGGRTYGIWKLAATSELKFKFQAHLDPNAKLWQNASSHSEEPNRAVWVYKSLYFSVFVHM